MVIILIRYVRNRHFGYIKWPYIRDTEQTDGKENTGPAK
jgi:hypothetical protein